MTVSELRSSAAATAQPQVDSTTEPAQDRWPRWATAAAITSTIQAASMRSLAIAGRLVMMPSTPNARTNSMSAGSSTVHT